MALATYGYEEGLLSNSMLQAAITCPVKYELMYERGIRPEKQGVWFNDAFVGNLVHTTIETCEQSSQPYLECFWALWAGYFGDALTTRSRSLLALYLDARTSTIDAGRAFGREYKAPEMTSHWKKNYTGLDTLLERLNLDVANAYPAAIFNVPYTTLAIKALVSLKNWETMRIGDASHLELEVRGSVGPDDAKVEMVGTIDRIEPRGDGLLALCDYKTGKWGYDESKLANSDQMGLYHTLLEANGYGTVVEWIIYDVYLGNTIRVVPTSGMLTKFRSRLDTNLRYFKQIKSTMGKVEVPTPAGSMYKLGCPCILAETGDCPYVYTGE